MNTLINETNFTLPGQTGFYRGKVREVYTIDDNLLVMIVSDRISAFDVVLARQIPWKGQVLNQIASHMLDETKSVCPNWKICSPHPNVTIGYKCEPYKVEMVIRGYLTGHAWRVYKEGGRMICGVPLPDGLKEHDKLPEPIITPTTKAHEGHDEDISREEIISKGIVSEEDYVELEEYTRALFQRGTDYALGRGLILVDTKYEFGKRKGETMLIDEIHTPDSSRYFYADGYEERQAKGEEQKHLDKEFVRKWLSSEDFQGKEGQREPFMSDSRVLEISTHYIQLYKNIMGTEFLKPDYFGTTLLKKMEEDIKEALLVVPS
jgi:phosphoribosylaminoimidazole-succinocarboxamide synthase